MRVLVTGGRDYADRDAVFAALEDLRERYGTLTVIQGGASGADLHARSWCYAQRSVRMINEPADWKQHGRAAGPLRNAVMIAEHRPDIVLAFRGGRGTADMIRKAEAAGIPVRRLPTTPVAPNLAQGGETL